MLEVPASAAIESLWKSLAPNCVTPAWQVPSLWQCGVVFKRKASLCDCVSAWCVPSTCLQLHVASSLCAPEFLYHPFPLFLHLHVVSQLSVYPWSTPHCVSLHTMSSLRVSHGVRVTLPQCPFISACLLVRSALFLSY